MSTTRRDFVKKSATIVAGIGIVSSIPGQISCSTGFSKNEKIVLGLIGCNGMGFSDLRAHLKLPNIECGAIDSSFEMARDFVHVAKEKIRILDASTVRKSLDNLCGYIVDRSI